MVFITEELRSAINDLSGDKNKPKLAPNRYLSHNSFYILEEYFKTKLTAMLIHSDYCCCFFLSQYLQLTVTVAILDSKTGHNCC